MTVGKWCFSSFEISLKKRNLITGPWPFAVNISSICFFCSENRRCILWNSKTWLYKMTYCLLEWFVILLGCKHLNVLAFFGVWDGCVFGCIRLGWFWGECSLSSGWAVLSWMRHRLEWALLSWIKHCPFRVWALISWIKCCLFRARSLLSWIKYCLVRLWARWFLKYLSLSCRLAPLSRIKPCHSRVSAHWPWRLCCSIPVLLCLY